MEQENTYGSLLHRMLRLQELHTGINQLQARVEASPAELLDLEATLEGQMADVKAAEERIEVAAKQRRGLELEVEALRAKLSHYRDQLMSVKTNIEYQAMLHEISYVENRIDEKEDAILEIMLETDELEGMLTEARTIYTERQREVESKKREVHEFVARSEEELARMNAELESLKGQLPQEFLERYHRIAAVRGGVAIAMVSNHSCEACHVRLRPQLLAEIRANRDIILCENCNRILYYPAPA